MTSKWGWAAVVLGWMVAGPVIGQESLPPGSGEAALPPGAFGAPGVAAPEFCADQPTMPVSGAFGPGIPCDPHGFPFPAGPHLPPNGFADSDCGLPCPRLSVRLDYLLLWLKGDSLPAVLTTGSAADLVPGGLDQPGTAVLIGGNQSSRLLPGGRISVLWNALPPVWSLETVFFFAQKNRKFRGQSDADGDPVLSRPYFDFAAQMENADPRALPNVLRGAVSDEFQSRLMGGEFNVRYNASDAQITGMNANLLFGARWLNLDERYRNIDSVLDLPVGNVLALTISDHFETSNQFLGGQLGGQLVYRHGGFTFGLQGKCAAGPNFQRVGINGLSAQYDFTKDALVIDNQGLYAQSSNSGVYRRTRFAVAPELALNCGIELSDRIRMNIGYNVFWLTAAARPGTEIDPALRQPVLNGPVVPARPRPTNRNEDFWAQWVNIGFEVDF